MIALDGATASVVAGAVVMVIAVAYIVVSMLARDVGGARLWALAAVLLAMAVVFAYVCSIAGDSSWPFAWGLGLSHAALVGSVGALVLGARAYNQANVEGPAFFIVGLALLTGAATIAETVRAVSAPGELWLLLSLSGLSVGVIYHAVTGSLRARAISLLMALGGIILGAYSAVRVIVLFTAGGDGDAYTRWFGMATTAIVVVVVVVLIGISVFVLRAVLVGGSRGVGADDPDILPLPVFRGRLQSLLRRSTERLELVAVIAVRIDDVPAVTVAFGREPADQMAAALRAGVRRFASPIALVGEAADSSTMHVATLASSAADARRQAGLLYRGIVRDFIESRDIVVPGIGIGVALSHALGYDADVLLAGALAAAEEAGASEEASVVIATVRDLAVDPFPAEPV
ncbi:MAG: hypothetical protein QM626_13325 [Microbacterium sp.]|uniref:hypothetical protein n=1 Tax=Microbacterium sp. TaxID=51671 RepID=UPI0039E4DA08